jgi:membrane protein required for beta-lactamase induction
VEPPDFFLVMKGPAAVATAAPQPRSLLCNPVMKVIRFFGTNRLNKYIDNVFHQLNALVIKTLKYSTCFGSTMSHPHVGAFYQTVLEYFSVFITSAFSW